MKDTSFNSLPTMIGSLPHTDPKAACAMVARFLPAIPAWPQLPGRSFREDMIVQYSEGFPGLVIEGGAAYQGQKTETRVYVNRAANLDGPLEKLYAAFLDNNVANYATSSAYAAGLYEITNIDLSPRAMKGQITGPVTWGLSVTDQEKKAIIYDDVLGDAVPKFLRLKAVWLEQYLSRVTPDTIVFLDEPYMASFGSAMVPLSRERVTAVLEEVLQGIKGLKGVHCCGNTDWPVLFATSTDIISFDAYNYAQSLALYPAEVQRFIKRQGVIAWGIVPNTAEALTKETVSSLGDRLLEAMAPFTYQAIPIAQLVEQGLLTPSCSLAGLTIEAAEQALHLLADLSRRIRGKYVR